MYVGNELMATVSLVIVMMACGHRADPPAPKTVRVEAPPDEPASSATLVNDLDAMLNDIDSRWRTDHERIAVPKPRSGFRVTQDNGVAVIIPEVELSLAVVAAHLAKRTTAKNVGLKPYTDGTLVTIDSTGAKAKNAPVVLPLNETLLMFLTPSAKDPSRLLRIDVAMP
jgi:hypothetical protein